MTTNTLPAAPATGALARLQEAIDAGMAPALAIMLDEKLFDQVQRIAAIMSKADGFAPKHCIGRTEVCFAIVTRSLVWRLDPFAVAQCTYQPVDGAKVAYEGKLVQAVLEQSGRIDGPITPSYYGDWTKVQGKFRMQKSEKGKLYAVATYTEADEDGLGLTLSALLKGETKPRTINLDLRQCHPRNSTLWATDAHTQIYYRAVRALGNIAMPSVLMGVPFLDDLDDDDGRAKRARDVNPRPAGNGTQHEAPPPEAVVLVDPDGEERAFAPGEVEAVVAQWCHEATDEQLGELIANNSAVPGIARVVEYELVHREHRSKQDDDPLHIAGLTPKDALATLELALGRVDAVEADRLLDMYQPRLAKLPGKFQDQRQELANSVGARLAAHLAAKATEDELPLT